MKPSAIIFLAFLLFGLQLTFGQWGPIVRLSETDSASYAYSGIPLVTSGQYIHAIWNDYYAGTRCLVYRRSTDNGVNWSPLVQLTKCFSSPYFFTYSAGSNVHLTYDSSGIRYRRSTDNGATWGARESLGGGYNHRLAANRDGFVFVIWEDWNDTIYVRRSTNNGANWSSSISLAKPYEWSYYNILVTDFSPYVFFVYASHDSIFFKRSTNNGATWESTIPVVATSGLDEFIFTADNRNRLHLAWSDDHTGNYEVYYIRSTNNGASWSGIARLTISNGTYLYWMAAKDNMVYLTYSNSSTNKTRRRSFDGGATWEAESNWPTFTISIALGEANWIHLAALHYIYPTGYTVAYFRSKNSGTTWADSAIAISIIDNLDRYPRAIALSNGNVHVLWEDYQYGNYEILYRRGVGLAGIDEENSKVETQSAKLLEVYPNPAKGVMRVRGLLTVKEIKIFDVSGKLVKEEKVTSAQSNKQELRISLKGINQGIYFLRLGKETKKFLVVK